MKEIFVNYFLKSLLNKSRHFDRHDHHRKKFDMSVET